MSLRSALLSLLFLFAACSGSEQCTKNSKESFESNYFIGTNMWYAPELVNQDFERLKTELDNLRAIGVRNLRILATGEDLQSLKTVLSELEKRDMQAVLYLNNAWEWCGRGYRYYLEKAGEGVQPMPQDSWEKYCEAMSGFAANKKAMDLFREHVTRTVSALKDSPAIFAWQICNEPRPFSPDQQKVKKFADYINNTAKLIKSIDPVHLVSTGSEGLVGCNNGDTELHRLINSSEYIDYITVHIWPLNWDWVTEENLGEELASAISKTALYIDQHMELAKDLGKPVVIEEFGYPRDGSAYLKSSSTNSRAVYYDYIFQRVLKSAREKDLLLGCNFWGWSGLAEQSHQFWQEGDDFCSDPSHEAQGLYGVYQSDSIVVQLIKKRNEEISAASEYSSKAKSLIDRLESSVRENKILFGHQDDLFYGHGWYGIEDKSDIKDVCGQYPAILGIDLGEIELGGEYNLDSVSFKGSAQAALRHHKRGGIVTLSWHARNPLTGGDSWDISRNDVLPSILQDGENHKEFLLWLEKVASYINGLRDENGELIPVIFRPWHEHTGNWFWWGQEQCSAQDYISLWKLTWDVLTFRYGLDNIVWAYSPNAGYADYLERYPGDEYVDIFGYDHYCYASNLKSFSTDLAASLSEICSLASQHNKIPALTETGFESINYEKWWTECLYPAIGGAAYVHTWRNAWDKPSHFYAPWPGCGTEEDFIEFKNKDNITFLTE